MIIGPLMPTKMVVLLWPTQPSWPNSGRLSRICLLKLAGSWSKASSIWRRPVFRLHACPRTQFCRWLLRWLDPPLATLPLPPPPLIPLSAWSSSFWPASPSSILATHGTSLSILSWVRQSRPVFPTALWSTSSKSATGLPFLTCSSRVQPMLLTSGLDTQACPSRPTSTQ